MTDMSLNDNYACGIAGGRLTCWGTGANGALGQASGTQSLLPNTVQNGGNYNAGATAVKLTTAYYGGCATLSTGAAVCWGTQPILGNNSSNGTVSTAPVNVSTVGGSGYTGTNMTAVAGGRNFVLGLTSSGEVLGWGANQYGQLGRGNMAGPILSPSRTISGGTYVTDGSGNGNATAIAAADFSGCILDNGGRVSCFGYNLTYQVGDGTTTNNSTPQSVVGLSGVSAISSSSHSANFVALLQ